MADNYLEKRYSEVFGKDAGKKASPRRPSLDTLLTRMSAFEGFDRTYKVHSLQLDAIIASAQKLDCAGIFFCPDASGAEATIRVSCKAATREEAIFRLGAIAQAMALKAAEMGLKAEPRLTPEPHCIIYVGKTASE